ncbi:putative UPF0481 protein [Tanacetum coccineum]|uniref:UPF0481 protein n=1 Tax=Tanacetum coccineum TaxID=301880 RepID=A0ABQ4ZYC4_9ASTR
MFPILIGTPLGDVGGGDVGCGDVGCGDVGCGDVGCGFPVGGDVGCGDVGLSPYKYSTNNYGLTIMAREKIKDQSNPRPFTKTMSLHELAPMQTNRKRTLGLENDVNSIYEKTSIHIHNKTISTAPSIYRVPNLLRKVNRSSYRPRLLSIGPFHKQSENLKRLEAHKVSYMHNLFERLESSPKEKTMKACIRKMLDKIEKIKSCYEGEMKVSDDNEFAKMMVLDGCFILELIYASHKDHGGHSVFDIDLVNLNVKHDLVLLENQIPFFVLRDIFKSTIHKFDPQARLTRLVLSFLQEINPFEKESLVKIQMPDSPYKDYDHILGLLHDCYHPAVLETDHGPKEHTKRASKRTTCSIPSLCSYRHSDILHYLPLSIKSRVGLVGKPTLLEVKGLIITPCKAGGPIEAASLPSSRGKAVYISPPPLPCGRWD